MSKSRVEQTGTSGSQRLATVHARGKPSVEQALEKSDERFRRVVESAPNAMVMIGATGTIEMVNTQAELVFGYPRAELLGHPVEMLVPERFRKHHPGLRGLFF